MAFEKENFNGIFKITLDSVLKLNDDTSQDGQVIENYKRIVSKFHYYIYFLLLKKVLKADSKIKKCGVLFDKIKTDVFQISQNRYQVSLETLCNIMIRHNKDDIAQIPDLTGNIEFNTNEFFKHFISKNFETNTDIFLDFLNHITDRVLESENSKIHIEAIETAFKEVEKTKIFQVKQASRSFSTYTGIGESVQKQSISTNAGWQQRVEWIIDAFFVRANKGSHKVDSINKPIKKLLKSNSNPEFKIYVGPPGCGKTREVKNIVKDNFNGKYTLIQIHPSYGYEDLVEGLKPLNFPDGKVRYDVVHGPLRVLAHKADGSPAKILSLIQKNEQGVFLSLPAGTKNRFDFEKVIISESLAIDEENNQSIDVMTDDIFLSTDFLNSSMKNISEKLKVEQKFVTHLYFKDISWGSCNYALILDELNRGNVPQLLGELIYLLGEEGSENTLPVKLQYSQESLEWPANLSLYATMNSADVSTDRLDQAVKRRFAMIHIGPNEKVFDGADFGFLIELNEKAKALIKSGFNEIKSLNDLWKHCKAETTPQTILTKINDKIISEASSFGVSHPHEKLLGHSYFIKICRKTATSLNGTESDEIKAATLFLEVLEIMSDEIIPALASILNADETELNRFLQELSDWPKTQKFSAYNFTHIEQLVEKMVFKESSKVTSLKDYKDLKSKKWPNVA